MEKGRDMLFLPVGSGRLLLMAERRANALQDLPRGERPAGFRAGVDLGFWRGALKVEEGMGEAIFDVTTVTAIREVFNGWGEHLLGSWSSSSQPRFRFVDMFRAAGSIFSASTSTNGRLLAGDAPDVKQSVRGTIHVWPRAEKVIPFCWFLMFIFVSSKERIRGASRLAKGCRMVVGVIVRAAILETDAETNSHPLKILLSKQEMISC